MIAPEIVYPVGTLILLAVLVWGVWQYSHRNRANDRVTEKATHESYEHPEDYAKKREDLKKEVRPSS